MSSYHRHTGGGHSSSSSSSSYTPSWLSQDRPSFQRRASRWDEAPSTWANSQANGGSRAHVTITSGLPQEQADRNARRVYVGNLPPQATEQSVRAFFAQGLSVSREHDKEPWPAGATAELAIPHIIVNTSKRFCFVTLATDNDTDRCLSMDGVDMPDPVLGSAALRIRRPKDCLQTGPIRRHTIPGVVSTHVPLDEKRLMLCNLPMTASAAQVKELCRCFGPLSAFNLIIDATSGASKGYAFLAYDDAQDDGRLTGDAHVSLTDFAQRNLHGFNVAGTTLTCVRAQQDLNERMRADRLQAAGVLVSALAAPFAAPPPPMPTAQQQQQQPWPYSG